MFRAARTNGVALPPEALFLASAMSLHVGQTIAIGLFDSVSPMGIAWLRVAMSAPLLFFAQRGWTTRWSWSRAIALIPFGGALAAMNLSFYMALNTLPMGTAVAIEFVGPIAVAGWGTRNRRGALSLLLAIVGVYVLTNVQLTGSATGVAFALIAGFCWALYIILGSKVARRQSAGDLGAATFFGALISAPLALPLALPTFASGNLLVGASLVALFASAIPYSLDQRVMRVAGTTRFALLLAWLPANATLVGFALLGQKPEVLELLGIGLVIVALLVSQRE